MIVVSFTAIALLRNTIAVDDIIFRNIITVDTSVHWPTVDELTVDDITTSD